MERCRSELFARYGCAGSDIFHPIGALMVGAVAGFIFVKGFDWCQNKLKIDDVLGVWPLHGLCGVWGGLAAGIFGMEALGGMGGVSFISQVIGTVAGAGYAFAVGFAVYGVLKATTGLRLREEQEMRGADLSLHHIGANPESDIRGA